MSYRMRIDPKSRFVARFISKLQRAIQDALIESGMTQQEVADKIGVNKSVINRRLSSDANLTARSIAEFSYAFDKDLEIKFLKRTARPGTNVVFRQEPTAVTHTLAVGPITLHQSDKIGSVVESEKLGKDKLLSASVG